MSLRFRKILIVAFAHLLPFVTKGQSYYFAHFKVKDGLAHHSVLKIMQDHKGFLWIGTKDGLNRYDGYTFKTFSDLNHKFGSMDNNFILSLSEDKNGIIWVGTGRGLFKYDPEKETFKNFSSDIFDEVRDILVDDRNDLWFLDREVLYHYRQRQGRLIRVGIRANCLAFDNRKNLILGTNDGALHFYDINRHQLRSVQLLDRGLPKSAQVISKVFATPGDDILIGTTKQGLKSYRLSTGSIHALLVKNSDDTEIFVHDIIHRSDNEYWIATESGIYIYDLAANVAKQLANRPGDPYALSDNSVNCLFQDRQKGLWAGTYFGGLNYYSRENSRFEKYYEIPGANSLSGSAVREICEDDDHNIWIGTEDAGLNKFERASGRFTNYRSDGRSSSISYPNIHGLLAADHRLYIGTFQRGLEIMDRNTGRIVEKFNTIGEKRKNANDFVRCIYQTKSKRLLLGTTGKDAGLYEFSPQSRTFKKLGGIPTSFVFSILEDHEGTIWTGSLVNGTYFFNPATGKKGNLRFAPKGTRYDKLVQGIYEDSKLNLWFATEGAGLMRLSKDRKQIKKFTTRDGLPSNIVFRIIEDGQSRLWVSSLKGLACIDLRTEQIRVYNQANGLFTDEFNAGSGYKDHAGRLYFGSIGALVSFDPRQFGEKIPDPSLYITGLAVNNKEIAAGDGTAILNRSILSTDTISLRYDQYNFSLEFAALNFSSPKATRYRYIMKGLDKDWTYLNTNRRAYFTGLPPGKYDFIVNAESNTGDWISAERHVVVVIEPPFWASNTAYLSYTLLAIATVWLVSRGYGRRLKKRNAAKLEQFEHQKEKEIYQSKIDFFTHITHEIQTPLTLIIGPVENILDKVDQLPSIRKDMLLIDKNANRLLELTDQLLDFRKTEMDQFGLNFVLTDIAHLVRKQADIFRQKARGDGIQLSVEHPKEKIEAFVDQEAFTKIVTNLISNAVKYARSKAFIKMAYDPAAGSSFLVLVGNDGKGIPDEMAEKIFEPFRRLRDKDKPGTGIGLSLARSLAELHYGKLVLQSGKDDHILFELTIPIHQQFEFNLSSWKNGK